MAIESTDLARRVGNAVEVRAAPLPLKIELDPPVTSADGLLLQGSVTLRIAVGPSPADRQLLADELLAGASAVGVDDLMRRFAPTVRTALADGLRSRAAEEAVGMVARDRLAESVRRASDRIAFACGLVVVEPLLVHVDCPALLERARHAHRLGQFRRAAEIARRFRELRAENPGIPPAKLLEAFDPTDRDELVANVMSGHTAPGTLWLVAGAALIEVGFDESRPRIRRTHAIGELGPLRSVTVVRGQSTPRLAVGARDGVLLVDPTDPNRRDRYRAAGPTSRGFNSAVVTGDRLLAAHGELGVVAWSPGDEHEQRRWPMDSPAAILVTPAGRVIAGARQALLHLRDQQWHEMMKLDAPLVGLANDGETVVAIQQDGHLALASPDAPARRVHRPAPVTAGAGWASPIGFRVIRAVDSNGIEAFGLDDAMTHQFTGPHAGLRLVAAGAGVVAGVSSDRQRLIVWHAGEPRQPAGEVHVAALTGHRIAGLAFG